MFTRYMMVPVENLSGNPEQQISSFFLSIKFLAVSSSYCRTSDYSASLSSFLICPLVLNVSFRNDVLHFTP